jgi:hypothetical protein
MFGFNPSSNPFFASRRDVASSSPLRGCLIGYLPPHNHFDEKLGLFEDIDMVIRNYERDGAVARFNEFYFKTAPDRAEGGYSVYRDRRRDTQECMKLIRKHPGKIRVAKQSKPTDGLARMKKLPVIRELDPFDWREDA